MAFGQEVTVKTFGPDKYGRTIGYVRLPDGRNLNQELVSEGMCWWYRKYARNNAVLEKLEADADPVCGGQHQIVPPFSSGR